MSKPQKPTIGQAVFITGQKPYLRKRKDDPIQKAWVNPSVAGVTAAETDGATVTATELGVNRDPTNPHSHRARHRACGCNLRRISRRATSRRLDSGA